MVTMGRAPAPATLSVGTLLILITYPPPGLRAALLSRLNESCLGPVLGKEIIGRACQGLTVWLGDADSPERDEPETVSQGSGELKEAGLNTSLFS